MAKKTNSKTPEKSSKAPKAKKAGSTSRNDRDDHRVPIQLLVDYRANGHYLFDFCKDLGSGGVFIQTTSPLPQGSDIDLTFTLPDSKETLVTKGHVIWVQSKIDGREDLTPGMGVQFKGFIGEQRKTLEDFVARYHGDRYRDKKPA